MRLPPWVVTRHTPSVIRASMAATTNCDPYFDAMASISAGSRTAALLTVTLSAPRDQLREGAASLLRGADVEVDQFVGPFGGVFRPQLHRVADVAQPDEVDALDGLSLADVEAGDYAFGKHLFSSSRVICPS